MNTIYKYPIEITDDQTIDMPEGAQVVHAGLDPQGQPCLWAKVNNRVRTEPRRIQVRGTGHPLPDDAEWVGTFTQGPFVWHVFTLQ